MGCPEIATAEATHLILALYSRPLAFCWRGKHVGHILWHRSWAIHEGMPAGYRLRAAILQDSADLLKDRFSRNGKGEDLEEAISLYLAALELDPPGDNPNSETLRHLNQALNLQSRHSKRINAK